MNHLSYILDHITANYELLIVLLALHTNFEMLTKYCFNYFIIFVEFRIFVYYVRD